MSRYGSGVTLGQETDSGRNPPSLIRFGRLIRKALDPDYDQADQLRACYHDLAAGIRPSDLIDAAVELNRRLHAHSQDGGAGKAYREAREHVIRALSDGMRQARVEVSAPLRAAIAIALNGVSDARAIGAQFDALLLDRDVAVRQQVARSLESPRVLAHPEFGRLALDRLCRIASQTLLPGGQDAKFRAHLVHLAAASCAYLERSEQGQLNLMRRLLGGDASITAVDQADALRSIARVVGQDFPFKRQVLSMIEEGGLRSSQQAVPPSVVDAATRHLRCLIESEARGGVSERSA